MSTEELSATNGHEQPTTEQPSVPVPHQQPDAPLPTKEYIQEITSVDLPDTVINHFQIYLLKDWTLGKLAKEDIHEIKWLGRTRAKEIIINHAPSNSILSPEVRADLYDLPQEDCLPSLSHRQKMQIIDLGELVYGRASRSEGGWQQDEMGKTMNVHRDESENEPQQRSGIWSIFG